MPISSRNAHSEALVRDEAMLIRTPLCFSSSRVSLTWGKRSGTNWRRFRSNSSR